MADRQKDFKFVEISEMDAEDVKLIRRAFADLASYLEAKLPDNRQKSVAFTNLEQANMWAVKSITHK